MVGEGAIDLGEKLGHFAAQRLEELRRKRTCHAVAAVDRDLHRARELHITQNLREVFTGDITLGHAHRCIGIELARKRGVDDRLVEILDAIAIERAAAEHHLQPVVLRRVVAAGDCDTRAGIGEHGREIDHRSGHHADVNGLHTSAVDALRERRNQSRPRQASIATDHDRGDAFGLGLQAKRCAHAACHRIGEGDLGRVAIDDAADVIGFEDRGRDRRGCHGRLRWVGRVGRKTRELYRAMP